MMVNLLLYWQILNHWHNHQIVSIETLTLITSGVTMRGKHVGFHTLNHRNPSRQRPDTTRQRPDTTRIRVKGVPLSADDGHIRRILEVMIKVRDEEILHMYREQLRVDGRLTGCETGDSIIISKTINCDIISSPIRCMYRPT